VSQSSDKHEGFGFNLDQLRVDVAAGKRILRVTAHALQEVFKDGLSVDELYYTFEHGEMIELYPDDNRGLLYAKSPEHRLPIHLVVKETAKEGLIITAYIPDRRRWIANRQRRNIRRIK